jgi:hypothetical protein
MGPERSQRRSIIASIIAWQAPQSPPARHALVTSEMDDAPDSMASSTWALVTA